MAVRGTAGKANRAVKGPGTSALVAAGPKDLVEPIVVPNTLWQSVDPAAYAGGRASEITHLREIEAGAARYAARTGQHATSIAALVRAGDLPGEPREPHGGRYQLSEVGEARSTAKARLRIRGRRGTLAAVEVQ